MALRALLGDRAPLESCLSIGCGTGGLERHLHSLGVAREIVGIDEGESLVRHARDEARASGMDIRYVLGDARAFLRQNTGAFDAVFFHQSLHHFDGLDDLMLAVRRALKPDGFLYVDEYIGPARNEWSIARLLLPNAAYRLLPRDFRRPHLIRAPINREDPTEAIQSSSIVRAIEREFRIVHRRDYGGNLLDILFPNLRHPGEPKGPEPSRFDSGVAMLIDLEDVLLTHAGLLRLESCFTVIYAEVPR